MAWKKYTQTAKTFKIKSILKLKVYSNQLAAPKLNISTKTPKIVQQKAMCFHTLAVDPVIEKNVFFLFWIVSFDLEVDYLKSEQVEYIRNCKYICTSYGSLFQLKLAFLQQQDVGGANRFKHLVVNVSFGIHGWSC